MGNALKLLICYHKKDVLLKDDVLTPIHVGRSLALAKKDKNDPELKWMMENMIGDDTGENISNKNASYNELTAIYWAWKNYDKLGNPEYIGFMHYRRHFIFRKSDRVVEKFDGITDDYFKQINYNQEVLEHLFDDCDYIAHIGRVDQVYKHYKENHHISDLMKAISILKRKYPDYASTADDFLQMSNANFCNMFIMPRKMFFEYCEWIFSILEEFEKEVDLSEKRLFISERLTGIFMEKKKREGFKQKPLPASFIQGHISVPIAVPYNQNEFLTAVMMRSVIKHLPKHADVVFYVLHNGEADLSRFAEFLGKYDACSLKYINVKAELEKKGFDCAKLRFPEHYPLILGEVLKENKVLYLDERALFFGDVSDFYTTCNNDEFWVVGLPALGIDSDNKELMGTAFSIHTGRLRSHRFLENVIDKAEPLSSCEVFNLFASSQVSPFPWWIYSITDFNSDGSIYYEQRRGDKRWGVWERALLYYDKEMEPWLNIQALYSVYWWEIAAEIPAIIPFHDENPKIGELFMEQSVELCDEKTIQWQQNQYSDKPVKADKKRRVPLKRVFSYWKQHGLKQTIKRIIEKMRGQ